MEDQLIKPQYKQTEVGLIPEDWEVISIADAVKEYQLGGNYSNSEVVNCYPLMKMGNIDRGAFKFEKIEFVTNEVPKKRDQLNFGDVIFNTRNTLELVGKVAIWKSELNEAYFNSNLMRFKFNENLIASNFFFNYLINTKQNIAQLRAVAIGTTSVAAIYTRDLKKVILAKPSLPEQKAIAGVLSDTDALIQALEKKISKKILIKKGVLQELMRPKDGWEVKTLGDVVDIRKGQLITGNTRVDGNIPVIAGGKAPSYFHNLANRKGKTVTISASGANAGYVSFHSYPIFASDCSTISENANYSVEFIFYFLQNNQDLIYKMQTGGAQPHIHPKDLNPISFHFPHLKEQTRIAQILSDMDKEIEQLEQKLANYKKVKQGMMQELLTGKIRLV